MKSNKNRIDRIATRIVCGNENDDAKLMSHDEIVEFLYSQVKRVEINVTLPDTSDFSVEDGRTGAKKYPRKNKKQQNDNIIREIEKEQEEVETINKRWMELNKTVNSLSSNNNGQSFYGDLILMVLKNRLISVNFTSRNNDNDMANLNPYDKINKNNPFIYEGIDTTADYRNFIVNKFKTNKMNFKECITHPYDFDMPLDVYETTAKPIALNKEIKIYIKFGIHNQGTEAKIDLVFENYSFHPLTK